MVHRIIMLSMTLSVVLIYVLFSPPYSSSSRLSTEYVQSCMVHRIIMLRKTLKVVPIYVLFSPPFSASFWPSTVYVTSCMVNRIMLRKTLTVVLIYVLFSPPFSSSFWPSTVYVTSRGGHRHLQIGRMLDIDLISDPPRPPPRPRCMYSKCGNLYS